MKKIPLYKRGQQIGVYALVDDNDAHRVSQNRWGLLQTKWGAYAKRNVYDAATKKVSVVLMHREISAPDDGLVVDHINGDGLDNRKENLRVVTPSENNLNRHGKRIDNSSGFTGVFRTTGGRPWSARVKFEGKTKQVGTFHCKVEAAIFRDIAAMEVQGEMATLNFPELRLLF